HVERQALEHDISEPAIGRRIAGPLLRLDQRIGKLVLAAAMDPHLDARQIEFTPIRPDPPHRGDLALAETDGKVGEIAETLDLRPARLGPGAFTPDLLLEARRPDQRAADACRAVE